MNTQRMIGQPVNGQLANAPSVSAQPVSAPPVNTPPVPPGSRPRVGVAIRTNVPPHPGARETGDTRNDSHGRNAVSGQDMPDPRAVTTVSPAERCLILRNLSAYFDGNAAVKDVSLDFYANHVTAIIGPSGCGKSTLLRCVNRMHETVAGASVTGAILLDDQPIYGPGTNAITVRRHIGMVFQRPTSFPTLSIRDNVAAGLKGGLFQRMRRRQIDEIVEDALDRAALLSEVKDRLHDSAIALSGGQQQRLCIARALATKPRVLLLDEPTASLDPASTQKVEELVYHLRTQMTVVIVTHNMQQAARVSDHTAFMLNGELVEFAPTRTLFTTPSDPRTDAYITGRFG